MTAAVQSGQTRASRRLRVVHVINSLNTGGAETQLARLVDFERSSEIEHVVLPLMEGGPLTQRVGATGALVRPLGVAGARNLVTAPMRVAGRLRDLQPDLVQGWLLQGNLAASIGVGLGRLHAPVLWNVRWTIYGVRSERFPMRTLLGLSGLLSRQPTRIIFNAQIAVAQHTAIGYPPDRAHVIPNGFDVGHFHPDPVARAAVRRELEVPDDAVVVGMVARYHPMKDHAMSVRAAARLAQGRPDVVFVYAGRGVDGGNKELSGLIRELGLDGRVRLLGERQDVARLYASFDVYWMSSVARGVTEGFPNVIAEAMACGVPCVATDVGDARAIIGRTGRVVASRDWRAFADATAELLDAGPETRGRLGEDARVRIARDYSQESIARAYHELYVEILGDAQDRRAAT